MRDVLVIVPTYNERDNVQPIVRAILAAEPRAEVLVVDDASPDGTGALAQALAAETPRAHVLKRAAKDGLGRAYLAGFRWALGREYRVVVQMDADFSHDPRDLPRLLAALEAGADVVLGSRRVAGGRTVNWGAGRRAISAGGSLYARTILGVGVHDLTGGFKAWRRAVLEQLALDEVRSTGYAFQVELTYRALRAGFRVLEIPIVFEDRRVGQSKMSRAVFAEAVAMVWRLRLDALRGRL
jgi:dolichol-phosphate mannosyltransferase